MRFKDGGLEFDIYKNPIRLYIRSINERSLTEIGFFLEPTKPAWQFWIKRKDEQEISLFYYETRTDS